MSTPIRNSVVVSAMVAAMAFLLLGNDSLVAQTVTVTPATGTPGSDERDMDMASPMAGTISGERTIAIATPSFAQTPPAAGQDQMGQMMDDCIDMMDMMMDMMMGDGGMPGPMGDGGMPGPMGDGGMAGPMGSPMDECLTSMTTRDPGDISGLMAFSTDQCAAMLGGDPMTGM